MRARLLRHGKEVLIVIALLTAVHLYKTRSHPGGIAPTHTARLLTGETAALGGQGSEPVLVHFWATWCGVCRMEESSIESLSKHARVLSIAVRSGTPGDVQRYMRERGLSFPVVNDPDGALARAYGVHEYPSSFFVSPTGNIITSEVGYTTSLGLRARMWLADW